MFAARALSAQIPLGGSGLGGNMSLIEHGPKEHKKVELVHWIDVGARRCQIVSEKCQQLVSLVPLRNPRVRLPADTVVVHPDVGERADRRRAPDIRVPVPEEVLKLRRRWFV